MAIQYVANCVHVFIKIFVVIVFMCSLKISDILNGSLYCSYPGNDYWIGKLSDSGHAPAACCSLISELSNPFIHYEAFASNKIHTHDIEPRKVTLHPPN